MNESIRSGGGGADSNLDSKINTKRGNQKDDTIVEN
jgi:hypothetical protein